VVADDVYPGTKHDGASVSSLYLLEEMESKTKLLFQYILRLKCPSFVLESSSSSFFTGVRDKFGFARLKMNLDRGPSTTVKLLLISFESNLQYFKRHLGGRAACILRMES